MGVFSELDIMFHNGESTDKVARFIISRNKELTYEEALKLAKSLYVDWFRSKGKQ